MTFKELYTKANAETGIKTVMVKIIDDTPPPYCIIEPDGNVPIKADDKTICDFNKAVFVLTTSKRDVEAETTIEEFFNNNEIDFVIEDEGYNETEAIYEVVYGIVF